MRRELRAAARAARRAGFAEVADFIEENGFVPSEDEAAELFEEESEVEFDATGMPLLDSEPDGDFGDLELSDSDIENIPDDLIDEDAQTVIAMVAGNPKKVRFVHSSRNSSHAMARSALLVVKDALDEETVGVDVDPDMFYVPDFDEGYDPSVTCPNCGDVECFPSFMDDGGLQHWTCNQCGNDFADEPAPEPVEEHETVTLDEYAEVDLTHTAAGTRWQLSVEGEYVKEGFVRKESQGMMFWKPTELVDGRPASMATLNGRELLVFKDDDGLWTWMCEGGSRLYMGGESTEDMAMNAAATAAEDEEWAEKYGAAEVAGEHLTVLDERNAPLDLFLYEQDGEWGWCLFDTDGTPIADCDLTYFPSKVDAMADFDVFCALYGDFAEPWHGASKAAMSFDDVKNAPTWFAQKVYEVTGKMFDDFDLNKLWEFVYDADTCIEDAIGHALDFLGPMV